jgi:hypothetical protein
MNYTLKQAIIKVVEKKDDVPPINNILSAQELERQFENILSHFDMHPSEEITDAYSELLKDRYNPYFMAILNGFTNLILLERDRAITMSKIKKKPIIKFED